MEAVVLQPAPEHGVEVDVNPFVALRNTQSEVSGVATGQERVSSDVHVP